MITNETLLDNMFMWFKDSHASLAIDEWTGEVRPLWQLQWGHKLRSVKQ